MRPITPPEDPDFWSEDKVSSWLRNILRDEFGLLPLENEILLKMKMNGKRLKGLSEKTIRDFNIHGGFARIIHQRITEVKTNSKPPTVNKNIVEAFEAVYKDDTKLISSIEQMIKEHRKQWEPVNTKFFSPYMSLFQSSGYGKSRLLKEISKKMHMFYISLMDPEGTGYPQRSGYATPLIEYLIQSGIPDEIQDRWSIFLRVSMKAYMEELEKSRPQEYLEGFPSDEIGREIVKKCETLLGEDKKDLSVGFWPTENSLFVFAFDEARTLITTKVPGPINLFRCLRRSLASVGRDNKLFAIFADTLSTISNFSPSVKNDSSMRSHVPLNGDLFPPFIEINTMDILKQAIDPTESVYDLISKSDERVFTLGRPLWGSLKYKTEELIKLGEAKLFGGNDSKIGLKSLPKFEQKLASLAVLCSRAGITLNSGSQVATELVAGYMATCLSISEDRQYVQVEYPSEPLLAEAAYSIMNNNENYNIMLDVLLDCLSYGPVNAGDRGEIIATLFLLKCFDDKQKERFISRKTHPITVEDFIHSMCGQSFDEIPKNNISKSAKQKLDKKLAGGLIHFTHFIKLRYEPTLDAITELLKRRAAAVLKTGQKGADFLIPIVLADSTVTFILIQVKNYKKGTKLKKNLRTYVIDQLKPSFVFSKGTLMNFEKPYLGIFLRANEGASKAVFTRVAEKDGNKVLYRISSFGFMSSPVLKDYHEKFQKLVLTDGDPMEGPTPKKDFLKMTCPLKYEKEPKGKDEETSTNKDEEDEEDEENYEAEEELKDKDKETSTNKDEEDDEETPKNIAKKTAKKEDSKNIKIKEPPTKNIITSNKRRSPVGAKRPAPLSVALRPPKSAKKKN